MNHIKEEVYKCSKCGLCKSVCPVYIALKNELFLPRGRYILLNNFFNNNKIISKNFVKNTDICLNCNRCMRFCPSNIDSSSINSYIKNKFGFKNTIFYFSTIYFFVLNIFGLFNSKNYSFNVKKPKQSNIIYFEGCYNKYINSSDKKAVLKILSSMGYNIEVSSLCCGYPYFVEGNFNKFNSNSEKLKKLSSYDYIICSCDSCYDTLSKIDELSKKLITFDEFLRKNSFKLPISNNTTYFQPLLRVNECYLPKQIKYVQNKGLCSLFENFFYYKHKKYALKILDELFPNKSEIVYDNIITTCNLSKMGLEKCLKHKKYKNKVFSYAEYIQMLLCQKK